VECLLVEDACAGFHRTMKASSSLPLAFLSHVEKNLDYLISKLFFGVAFVVRISVNVERDVGVWEMWSLEML